MPSDIETGQGPSAPQEAERSELVTDRTRRRPPSRLIPSSELSSCQALCGPWGEGLASCAMGRGGGETPSALCSVTATLGGPLPETPG